MADEVLRMQAEVQDRFSGPLKALRAALLDTSRQGAAHGEALAKGLNKAEAAAQATANTAKTVLNPALAAIGVTGLGAGVAVSGIVSALNSLGSNLSGLGALSRETSMAADQLRVFQSVAGKFGISSDASSAAAKVFAQNMRDIRRGVGETMGFLQSQSPAVAEFAIKLKNTTSNDEANKLTEQFLERIPNAVDRGRFAERIYGSADLGRLGDGSRGSIADLNRATEQKFGPLPKGAVESAERYERAIADLRSSMQRVGDSIAIELLGPAEKFTTWVDQVVAGKRGDFTQGLREGIRGIKTELEAINWKQFGDDSLAALRETTALVGSMAKGFHDVAEAIHSLREGKYADALARADSASGPVLPGKEAGADGPLRRRLAPRVGDDEITAKQSVSDLRRLLDASKEAGDHLIGRAQQRMGLIEAPEAVQKKLQDAEAELARLQARTPEQRQKDFDTASERLRKSVDNLSEQLKTKQDATAQKSSLDGDELFGGARIQAASLGGARIFGGPGGNGPIPEAQRDAARESFRRYLMQRVPGYNGGSSVPTLPDGTIPGLGYKPGSGGTPRLPGLGRGGSIPGIPDSVPMSVDERNTLGLIMRYESHGQNTMNYVGRQQGLSPLAAKGYTAQGYYQMLNSNWRRIAPGLGITAPNAMSGSLEEQTRVALHLLRNGGIRNWSNYNPALRGALARGERAPIGGVPELAAGRPAGMPRPEVGQADGEGWAAREKARKAFEAMQQGEGRLDASAGRAGVVGAPKIENNGSVSVVVQRPGPDTAVRTSASGELFKNVVLQRGRTMASAGGT